VHDISTLGRDQERIFQEVLGRYDAPAYVRRALRVQQSYDSLLAACRRQREEWLDMVRIRLATLIALARDWAGLNPFLADDQQCRLLVELHQNLGLKPLVSIPRTPSPRRLRSALRELCESLERFNLRWRSFLCEICLDGVNQERSAYNRYFLLEKECAVRSVVLARRGFRPLEPLTVAEIAALFPELPVPSCATTISRPREPPGDNNGIT
jgi:hypothetical protein